MKKLLALTLALVLVLALAACGKSAEPAPAGESVPAGETKEPVTLTVAASPTPHAEILAAVKDELAAQNIDLKVVEYTDYIQPNMVTESGEVDANYFQHLPYLEDFNKENNTHLVSVAAVHYEPFGLYPGKTATLDALAEGAQIAVPNDGTNEARALNLLAAQGLITLAPGVGLAATKLDIQENPKKLDIVEMEAAQMPRTLSSVDMAVINGNYAIPAGLKVKEDAIAIEAADSEAAKTYANILVVKEGNEKNEAIAALVKALTGSTARDFIEKTYEGAVVPSF